MKKGLTQQQLADACGLDISYIGGIERGQRNPTLGVIHSIAEVLGTKVAELTKRARV
jgi:transcriptional regulator with XRE-family HTH domain